MGQANHAMCIVNYIKCSHSEDWLETNLWWPSRGIKKIMISDKISRPVDNKWGQMEVKGGGRISGPGAGFIKHRTYELSYELRNFLFVRTFLRKVSWIPPQILWLAHQFVPSFRWNDRQLRERRRRKWGKRPSAATEKSSQRCRLPMTTGCPLGGAWSAM